MDARRAIAAAFDSLDLLLLRASASLEDYRSLRHAPIDEAARYVVARLAY